MCFFVWNVWFGKLMCSNLSNWSNDLGKRIEFKLQHSAGNRTAHSGSRGKLVLDKGMWTAARLLFWKMDSIESIVKGALVLWSCMAASHRPSAASKIEMLSWKLYLQPANWSKFKSLAWSIRVLQVALPKQPMTKLWLTFHYPIALECFCIRAVNEKKMAFLPKACATAFDLRIFQPRKSRSATSHKAEKACKCENNLHLLSLDWLNYEHCLQDALGFESHFHWSTEGSEIYWRTMDWGTTEVPASQASYE